MAIRTHISRTAKVLDFLMKEDLYFAIGKSSPWVAQDYKQTVPPDPESRPPVEDPHALGLKQTIGYKKVNRKFVVEPLVGAVGNNEVIDYLGVTWRIVPINEVLSTNATHIYVECNLDPGDFPLGPYRQVGLFSGLKPKSGVTGKANLLPSEVDDEGVLEVLENRIVSHRQEGVRESLSYILKY